MKHLWLHEQTGPAFEGLGDNEPAPVAVSGIGVVEQHAPRLPRGPDANKAVALVHEVAKQKGGAVLAWLLYSPLGVKGAIKFGEDTLLKVIMDTSCVDLR